jgi:hypothetical protein
MATQTYVKSGSGYTAGVTFDGDDADQVGSDYQVYVSVQHEWGYPIFDRARLTARVEAGSDTISVDDETLFVGGDSVVFLDGTQEAVTVDSVDTGSITFTTALVRGHNAGTNLSLERLADRNSANNYQYELTADDLESSGIHKIKWRIVRSGENTFINQSLTVFRQYIDEGTFFDTYPELETDFGDLFDQMERTIRLTINTVCGQNFEYYPSKLLTVDGTGRNTLPLPMRIESLLGVTLQPTEDITGLVKIQNSSKRYLQLVSVDNTVPSSGIPTSSNPNWGDRSSFDILGNWGWQNIPQEVTDAAGILIADRMNEDSKYTRHGMIEVYMDTHRQRYDSIILGTIGNIEAETLLMDYMLFIIGEI